MYHCIDTKNGAPNNYCDHNTHYKILDVRSFDRFACFFFFACVVTAAASGSRILSPRLHRNCSDCSCTDPNGYSRRCTAPSTVLLLLLRLPLLQCDSLLLLSVAVDSARSSFFMTTLSSASRYKSVSVPAKCVAATSAYNSFFFYTRLRILYSVFISMYTALA